MTILLLMGLTVLLPLVIGVPIAVTLGGSGLLWIALLDPNLLRGAGHAVWNTAENYVLISIPLFILMGELIERANFANRFYDAVSLWLRPIPGGLLHANIAACSLFSAVSGSSVATAATIGKAAIPSLERLKYDRRLTLGSLAAGGTLGILIPPSIPLIIYAALVEVSLGQLVVAAIIPGVMMALIFSGYLWIMAWRRPEMAPRLGGRPDVAALLRSLGAMLPLFFIIGIILCGIYFGWATPTEVAALGVLAAAGLALIQRQLTWPVIRDSVVATVRFTAMLMLVIIGAQIFSFAIFSWGVNYDISDWIAGLEYPRLAILGVVIAIYLLLGMFIDAISMMVLTLSVVFPIILKLEYDPIWFGIVLVILLEIGLITPPVGMNLYTIQALDPARISLGEVTRGALPFVGLLLAGIALLIAFPSIALWLPSLMFR